MTTMTATAYPPLVWPVTPNRGLRGTDAWGNGAFGAVRSKADPNGVRVAYPHKGQDFETVHGDVIPAVFDGIIDLLGVAYPDDPLTPQNEMCLRTIHLKGVNAWEGLLWKYLYAAPTQLLGKRVWQGEAIGFAQDRAAYAAQAAQFHPDLPKGPMTNHMHGELYALENGVWMLKNPMDYLS